MDSDGNLFGTTLDGGDLSLKDGVGDGTVFEIPSGASTIETLVTFEGSNGSQPSSELELSGGNLIGTTTSGGGGYGTIFEITDAASSGRAFSVVASFNESNGNRPIGQLAMDSMGDLFGATVYGGADSSNDGTIFELPAGSATIHTLVTFDGEDGSGPDGVVLNSAGILFGTTGEGGDGIEGDGDIGITGDGTVFEIDTTTETPTVTTIASFDYLNGALPTGDLMLNSGGNLYGTTYYGTPLSIIAGLTPAGSVFELSPTGSGVLVVNATSTHPVEVQTVGDSILATEVKDGNVVPIAISPLSQITSVEVVEEAGPNTVTIDAGAPPTTVVGSTGIDTVVSNGSNDYFTDTVSGNSGAEVVVQGTSALTLQGVNTYGGATEIDSGAILCAPSGTLSPESDIADNGTLNTTGSNVVGGITGTGILALAASASLRLLQNSPGTESSLGSLTFGSDAALDITDNTLDINETNVSLAQMTTWVLGGTIWSSLVTGPDSQASRAVGYGDSTEDPYTVTSGDVEARYVPIGDTNLDGTVNLTDYTRAVNNFNLAAGYSGGDVLNQGAVDIADITAIVNDYNNSLGSDGL
jgi:uncharacterized repeat protein (TIGR03803 family)/autotransporter-associated beta strand protein